MVRVWETDPEEAENVRANLPEAGDEAKRRRGLEGHPPCASSCSRMAFSCFCPSLSPAELHPTESQLVAAHHYPGKVAPCQDHEPKSRLLEAASSTRRPRGKYRGKLRRRRLSALPAMVCSPGTSCILHGLASSAPANSPPPPHPLHLRPGLAAARGRDRGVAGGLSLADRRSVTRRMCRI